MAKSKSADNKVPLIQVRYILDAFDGELETQPRGWADGKNADPIEFLYRKDHLLVRDQDVMRLRAAGVKVKKVRHPIPGLARVRVAAGKTNHRGGTLLDLVDRLNAQFGAGFATVDHLLNISPGTHCPATEPDGVPPNARPRPAVSASRCDGRGSLVAVVDTGLLEDARSSHEWMRGVEGEPEPETKPHSNKIASRYTGHGTFIASLVRAMAPRADVRVARIFEKVGANFESEVVKKLYDVLDWAPDVISLSAGTHTWRNRGLLSFRVFVDGPLRERPQTVLVACAGNDGLDWKFSPAKMKGVLSVGALAASGDERAWFTNYGKWVKVYAPGENLVHAYATGRYKYVETQGRPDHYFKGMASWSGTSFATPVVAGLIAARMSGTGETAGEAAASLLDLARAQALPGVGPVLRPGQACLTRCEPGCPSVGHQRLPQCCGCACRH
ncbi:MAG TPA: S8/S53 family peptidase [Streptosporangiaceae bacterium]|nr:S8/S53 family peptidase [Streptosporangiaceae bacterium]